MPEKQSQDGRTLRAQRTRLARRAQVLAAALQTFAQKGYHRTSVSDIIQRAGIARGTFYLYFKNKRAIFEELLSSYLERIASAVRRVQLSPGAPPPQEQIRRNVERVVDVLLENRDFTKLLLVQALGQDPDFDQQVATFYATLLGLIQGALVLGQEMNLVRPCDTKVVASCILGSIKEVAHQILLGEDSETVRRDHLVREILEFALSGIYVGPDAWGTGADVDR